MNVKHTRIGLWDLYEDTSYSKSPFRWPDPTDALPYVARMLTEIASIPACAPLLLALLARNAVGPLVGIAGLPLRGVRLREPLFVPIEQP